jgi:hypothetical protein
MAHALLAIPGLLATWRERMHPPVAYSYNRPYLRLYGGTSAIIA